MASEIQPAQQFQYDTPEQNTPNISQEMRDNFEGVARTFLTDDDALPAAPREGQQRIFKDAGPPASTKLQWYDGATWRTLIQRIEGGVAAPLKQIVDVTVPQTTWTIDHNIGSYPVVQVFDNTWNQFQVVPTAPGANQYLLVHVNENRVVITHTGAQDGHVIILG